MMGMDDRTSTAMKMTEMPESCQDNAFRLQVDCPTERASDESYYILLLFWHTEYSTKTVCSRALFFG